MQVWQEVNNLAVEYHGISIFLGIRCAANSTPDINTYRYRKAYHPNDLKAVPSLNPFFISKMQHCILHPGKVFRGR